jgi:hypothetical protein
MHYLPDYQTESYTKTRQIDDGYPSCYQLDHATFGDAITGDAITGDELSVTSITLS